MQRSSAFKRVFYLWKVLWKCFKTIGLCSFVLFSFISSISRRPRSFRNMKKLYDVKSGIALSWRENQFFVCDIFPSVFNKYFHVSKWQFLCETLNVPQSTVWVQVQLWTMSGISEKNNSRCLDIRLKSFGFFWLFNSYWDDWNLVCARVTRWPIESYRNLNREFPST